ncbi:type VII secretion target [Micromonospora sp. NPDC050397]|uniref:type VII secretion target n=1 Tax=Micromonospora sp. NPDC050397 TaxID=3364279 RepID=UPI00384C03B9
MHDDLIEVRTGELRGAGSALGATAHRLGQGLAGTSPPAGLLVTAPGWVTTTALVELESAVHEWLTRIGGRVATTADGLRAAADAYDSADDRAATRLTAGR